MTLYRRNELRRFRDSRNRGRNFFTLEGWIQVKSSRNRNRAVAPLNRGTLYSFPPVEQQYSESHGMINYVVFK